MRIERWPIVSRPQLVQAFRPGEPSSREGPFRTLRAHGWSTSGVRVVTRTGHSAAGRVALFSVLNLDAARFAREGRAQDATRLAKAAAALERSDTFLQLQRLLSGLKPGEVAAVLEGTVQTPETLDVLRRLAVDTRRVAPRRLAHVFAGTVSRERGLLLVTDEHGARTAIPHQLADAVHRGGDGDCLALTSQMMGEQQMVTSVSPGIDTEPRFSPFGRSAAVHSLTRTDAKRLQGRPAPLMVLVPVALNA